MTGYFFKKSIFLFYDLTPSPHSLSPHILLVTLHFFFFFFFNDYQWGHLQILVPISLKKKITIIIKKKKNSIKLSMARSTPFCFYWSFLMKQKWDFILQQLFFFFILTTRAFVYMTHAIWNVNMRKDLSPWKMRNASAPGPARTKCSCRADLRSARKIENVKTNRN